MSREHDSDAVRLGLGLGNTSGSGNATPWLPPTPEELTTALPGFEVQALAGRGGAGAVYRAVQTRLGRTVALKVVQAAATSDPLARERFEREARVMSSLTHPGILQVFDLLQLPDGTPCIVSEWVEGGDLARSCSGKPQDPSVVAFWIQELAQALDAAHARGIVHRDLKPANVLVRENGRLVLADFGVAHARGAGFTTALTLSGTTFGTLNYMAPEQLDGNGTVSPATDVYALGVMTHELLTGRVPRGAFRKASELAQVPPAVDGVIERALAEAPVARFQHAGEFAAALEAALWPKSPTRTNSGKRTFLLTALAACAALAVVLWSSREEPAPSDAKPAHRSASSSDLVPSPSRAEPVTAEPAPSAPAPAWQPPPWSTFLGSIQPEADALAGRWECRDGQLFSGDDVCVVRAGAVPGDAYDVALEFTRLSGENSVAVFLPTRAGPVAFELDAWNLGLGGLQLIDGRDMRAHGEHFPGRLANGVRQNLVLEVRANRVTAIWQGQPRRTWQLEGRTLAIPDLWRASPLRDLGLGTWSSPTVLHRVDIRSAAGAPW